MFVTWCLNYKVYFQHFDNIDDCIRFTLVYISDVSVLQAYSIDDCIRFMLVYMSDVSLLQASILS